MSTSSTRTLQIKKGRKFEHVRGSATQIFFRDGYTGASVDDIAGAARVSKATLYSYFPEKSVLFREVVRAAISNVFCRSPYGEHRGGDVDTRLPKMLKAMASWAAGTPCLSLLRIVTAEAPRFPEEAALYDREVHAHISSPLAAMIDYWIERGQIEAHDSSRSAKQLVAMVTEQVRQETMFATAGLNAIQLSAIADGAAQLFLSAHATSH